MDKTPEIFPLTKLQLSESDKFGVGFGRPPKGTRFKPGQSGNPSGKRGPKTTAQILRSIMRRKVRVQGRTGKISVHDAIFLKFIEKALQGDRKAADFILDCYGPVEAAKIACVKENARREAKANFDPKAAAKQWEYFLKSEGKN